jgi:hypothetical protein
VATVVAVMDRDSWDANTDNIVVVDPRFRRLLWVPRDLWCERLGQRINRAFALGGHAGLLAALRDHRISAQHGICFRRQAVERALEGVSVTVPVEEEMHFWYPLEPLARIQEGRKQVSFSPPAAELSGERLHQWVGARQGVDRAVTDLDRIRRQQVFVGALLRDGFDFGAVLRLAPERVWSSGRAALDEVAKVDGSWSFETVSNVAQMTVGESLVLRRATRRDRLRRRLLRWYWRVRWDAWGAVRTRLGHPPE